MDTPKGRTTHIHRTTTLCFPSCSQDFIVRIVPLLKLALWKSHYGIYNTTYIFDHLGSRHIPLLLVPTYVPFSDTTPTSSSTSSERSTASTSTGSSSRSSAVNVSNHAKRTKLLPITSYHHWPSNTLNP